MVKQFVVKGGDSSSASCCPDAYRLSGNPQFPVDACPGPETYCLRKTREYSTGPAGATKKLNFEGTCVANPPDCGQFGKPYCVIEGYATLSDTGVAHSAVKLAARAGVTTAARTMAHPGPPSASPALTNRVQTRRPTASLDLGGGGCELRQSTTH